MTSQRLNVTLPDDVSEILNTKRNKSEYLAEAVREKAINDKKKEVLEKARKLKHYYENDDDLNALNSLDSQDFVD